MNILEYLRLNNIDISAPCGGNGTCGKCLVSIDGGEPTLACRSEYGHGMDIRVINESRHMVALGADKGMAVMETAKKNHEKGGGRYGIAIDIGTTTIASVICDADSGRILSQKTSLNPNISFGADVISRIKAGMDGNSGIMRTLLQEKIRGHVFKLINDIKTSDTITYGMNGGDTISCGMTSEIIETNDIITIDPIVIAGNTTMVHVLMGYDLTPLGKSPYKPVSTDIIQDKASAILGIKTNDITDSHTVIFPGTSAFVGGDIISGLYNLDAIKTNDIFAFIDLGTNGEMALVTPGIIYVASSPAGPVFEGGGVSCGVGAVSGAIDHVRINKKGKPEYTTIDDENLVKGICGTGVIDCASELFRMGMCDVHGSMDRDYVVARYPDSGKVLFTQKDMRQVQLAKAAIAAGFEIICKRAGIAYDDISALYLAGGMGFYLNVDSAINIGLVPEILAPRVHSVGNGSLGGAIKLICADNRGKALEDIMEIAKKCRVIELAEDPSFQDTYISRIDLRRF